MKHWSWVLGIVVVLVLGACSEASGSNNNHQSDPNVQNSTNIENEDAPNAHTNDGDDHEAEADPITLQFGWTWSEESFHDYIREEFYDEFPHITLEFVQVSDQDDLQELITAGQVPDIITGLWLELLHDLEVSYALDDLIEEHNMDLSIYPEETITALRNQGDGNIFMFPFRGQVHYTYFNKHVFDLFGAAYPEDDMTWEETINLAREVTGEVDGVQYLGLDFEHYGFMPSQLGLAYLDPETHEINAEHHDEWANILQLIESMKSIPGNVPTESMGETVDNRFQDGHVAMYQLWNRAAVLANWQDNGDISFDWDVVSFPHLRDDHRYNPHDLGNIFSISRTSEYKDEAFQVVEYLISPEHQIKEARLGNPTSLAVDEVIQAFGADRDILREKNLASYYRHPQHPGPENTSRYESVAGGIFGEAMERAAELEADYNTILREFIEEAEAGVTEAMASE